MTTPKEDEPVDAEVFNFLDTYLDALERGEVDDDSPVESPAPIGDFLHTFFREFFEAGWNMEITTIDDTAKAQATRIRLERVPKTERPTAKLISSFEDLCDMWADLLGFAYVGHQQEMNRFYGTYLRRLVGRIRDWAGAAGHDRIRHRAELAVGRFKGGPQ